MLEPVQRLAAFMSHPPDNDHPAVFARHGLCILENFAPYQFCGPDAAAAWEAGYRAHTGAEEEAHLAARFGAAQDFGETGDRAYFSLPTTWTGLSHGRRFEEHGAWEFVLERDGPRWRILSYGWGVTSRAEPAS